MTELAPGDYVVAQVRRAGTSVYDVIDSPDLTTDDEYFEHGISRVHGFLTERYVEEPRYLIRIPQALRDVAVLLEPLSINAGRAHFEEGVRDMAMSEANRPGWLVRLLTHPVRGLDRYAEALSALAGPGVIKTYIEIAELA